MQFLKSFLSAAILTAAAICASAQALPVDGQIRTGKLDNGLTYYVRYNDNPKGVADFYIVHDVGALQEEDNQDGLAHFLEHMAFNGLKHYPGKSMLAYLAKNGVRFGANVNAFTSKTETCYHIDAVPVQRESFVDSVLLILHDWSGDILCEQDELDRERGVIREEWRRSFDSRRTLFTEQSNLVYQGAKQSKRTVLGSLDVIDNFKREDILNFYRKWYRPDLQAVIVVGDIDAAEMEAKIRTRFADLPKAVNPAQKETYRAPEADGPIFQNLVDSALSFQALKVFYRTPYPEKAERAREEFYKDLYCRNIVSNVMSDRMKARIKNGANLKSSVMVQTQEGNDYYVNLFTILGEKDGKLLDLIDFYGENTNRMIAYGISGDEIEVAKMTVKKRYHLDRPMPKASLHNSNYVAVCHNNFVLGQALTEPDVLHKIQNRIIDDITLADVNDYVKKVFVDSDKIYSWFSGSENASRIPSLQETKAALDKALARKVEPGFLESDKMDLAVDAPAGSITKTRKVEGTDSWEWTLSNGAKVYWTPVGNKAVTPDLSLLMYFETGYNALPQDRFASACFAGDFIKSNAGFRGAENDKVQKDPACNLITRLLWISQRNASVMMQSPASVAENAFKMANLTVTDPYLSTDKLLQQSSKRTLESLSVPKKDAAKFNDAVDSLVYGNHPWSISIDSAAVLGTDMDLVGEVYAREFNPTPGMQVFIASNMDEVKVKEYVSKYIASIPAGEYPYTIAKVKERVPAFKGDVVLERTGKKEVSPASTIFRLYSGKVKPSSRNLAAKDFVNYILSQRLLNKIREERGGTYAVSFTSRISEREKGRSEGEIKFKTRPELHKILIGDMDEIVAGFCKDGPTEKELEEARTYLVKHDGELKARHAESMAHTNSEVANYIRNKVDYTADKVGAYKSVNAKDVRKVAAQLTGKDLLTAIYNER